VKAPGPLKRLASRPVWVVSLFAVAVIALGLIIAGLVLMASDAVSDTSLSTVASTSTSIPTTSTTSPTTTDSTSAGEPSTTTTTLYTHPIKDPVRIVIPAIKADALIVKVGILANGSMDVPPFGLAGWYRLGPAPGASGPSVIVGHVDTKKGPDVFYRLRDLKPGDEILVYDKSGDMATFVVDSSELILKSELPTTRIWNNTYEPVIRLITCGGKFDRSTGHYLSNTIVYGHLAE
jgi:sortase (surface protein transpeptidase)